MLRKRMAKIEEVRPDNPHYAVELKKRILQMAAVSISLLEQMEARNIPDGIHPFLPRNLPDYTAL